MPMEPKLGNSHGLTADKKLEYIPISKLKPYEKNARTHSPRQIRQIARSIETFGFVNPVLIDRNRRIICGHGRVAAAQLLGLKAIPTITIEHLSEAELKAYILADNRLAEKAGWDRDTLAIELQGLIDLNFEVELTGFETAEIDILLDEFRVGQTGQEADDVIPSPRSGKVVCRAGDLWLLGRHRLFCGDARDAAAYRVLMAHEKAQFVFTDPPYNVPIAGHVSGLGRIRHREFCMARGELSRREFTSFLEQVFEQLAANTIDGSIHQICMDWRHMWEMIAAGEHAYTTLMNVCVWNKVNGGMGSFYRSKHELVFVWKNGKSAHVNNIELGRFGRSRTNVWDYAGVNSFGAHRLDDLALHPTTKPVALVTDAIKDCSRRDAIILDPFAGSGTLCIASENTGRRAHLMEIDATYCDVIIRRWQDRTGKRAVHAASGATFERIEDEIEIGRARNEKRTQGKGAKGCRRDIAPVDSRAKRTKRGGLRQATD